MPSVADARRAILDLLADRDEGKTICPSEAARALGGDDGFRPLMPVVRDAARDLVADGEVQVTQGGEVVDLDDVRGPIRLGVPAADGRPETQRDPPPAAGGSPPDTRRA